MTKEPHRSRGVTCATVTSIDAVIDAVRYAYQHPTLTGILRSGFARNMLSTKPGPHGCTINGEIGVSPKISGAYIASTRAGGNSKAPALFKRMVYSTLHWPCGT